MCIHAQAQRLMVHRNQMQQAAAAAQAQAQAQQQAQHNLQHNLTLQNLAAGVPALHAAW